MYVKISLVDSAVKGDLVYHLDFHIKWFGTSAVTKRINYPIMREVLDTERNPVWTTLVNYWGDRKVEPALHVPCTMGSRMGGIPCSAGSRLNGSLYPHAMNNKQLHIRYVATKLTARPLLFSGAGKVCSVKLQINTGLHSNWTCCLLVLSFHSVCCSVA